MKKVTLIIIILIAILIFSYFFSSSIINENPSSESQPVINNIDNSVNYKAKFLIYTNGTLRIFTDPKYHNKSNKAFIEPDSPNTVTIKESGTTWRDFFTTLPMKLEEDCLTTGTGQTFCNNEKYSLQFYINGVKNQKALDEEIRENDKLLITYESEDSSVIQKQINSLSDL